MENLYSFSKNAWHVQFFKWMWNVDPVDKYKTMCPYFWQFIGSIIILPIIILAKLFIYTGQTIADNFEGYSEKQAERESKKLLIRINSAKSIEDYEKLLNSKCYSKYIYNLYLSNEISDEAYTELRDKKFKIEREADYKKAKKQVIVDNIKYGVIGKLILYVATSVVLSLVIYGFILVAYMITLKSFLTILFVIFLTIVGLLTIFFIVFLFVTLTENKDCSAYNPTTYLIKIFKFIWKLFMIMIDMIINLYKQSCPTITWK
jgi:ABC-type multidrug transport system fused ATPase/permease subunit